MGFAVSAEKDGNIDSPWTMFSGGLALSCVVVSQASFHIAT
jgi:hypothetical protein